MMELNQAIDLFNQAGKRYHLIGDESAGVLAGLDLEGRLFITLHGTIVNRINPKAILGQSNLEEYLNPGGDGLWPGPEGSRFGYNYSTGKWRVPPGLTAARYMLVERAPNSAVIRAEVDLINSQGLGVPTLFERAITIAGTDDSITVTVTESIEYLGSQQLGPEQAMLVPWSLCQFDSGPECQVIFPHTGPDTFWDMYDPSDDRRCLDGQLWRSATDGTGARYQVGLAPTVPWVEFHNPQAGLTVRRSINPLKSGLQHIDITDRDPSQDPQAPGTCLSFYSDPSGFMEIEAAGGCRWPITPAEKFLLTVSTQYSI